MNFKDQPIISMRNFSREMIDHILAAAEKMEPIARGEERSDLLSGKILAVLFFEPSTRTRMSFETAMLRLGGDVLNLGSVDASSIAKGETLADTIRVVDGYVDAIVLRHPKEGAAHLASEFSSVPILNAGDGAGHHPTQTLLDLYTIKRESHLEDLKIALAGDLKYGRTVHSLCYALSHYGAQITLISPKELRMPEEIINDIIERGAKIKEVDTIEEAAGDVDVLYMTRIQKERFPDPAEYRKVANKLKINLETLKNAKPELKIMHPLPRVNEIDASVDATPHACYFKQAFYGVPVRMALLGLVLGAIE
ncbi:MAG: aspartate carbamoyltransferase catalytic subunit [Methanolobus sp.]|jgi:aspartate carbamoyltransferase catalytic subunit|uniref:aspartate carbamoyltransferase n=1 Tax=unclassified Methanolobus TaxID=2629569 RepID=UPI0024AC227F|nr:aspartate carbamoyltransferase [Methanolobus sp.]MDI3485537.1 aspartate carbamoyltransferase catalytic subunit [Methanolobus sp.]MDK2832346.1 aspartate carbamoyltransferase catalytic subunit [Methanolobus sp.]MDK2938811.1 aspartate carbamoyltransferase catalytic subunit [Methanolobus sp.]